jgi:hypothetical protein
MSAALSRMARGAPYAMAMAGFQRPAANPTEISRKGLTSTPLLGKNQPPAGRRFNQAT